MWLIRVAMYLLFLLLYDDLMSIFKSLIMVILWIRYLVKTSKEHVNRIVGKQNPKTYPYDKLYGLLYRGQKFMKLFLYETRNSELSNHMNYKSIKLFMREL